MEGEGRERRRGKIENGRGKEAECEGGEIRKVRKRNGVEGKRGNQDIGLVGERNR